MKKTSHMGALIGLTSVSALLALITGIIGLNADDLETMLGLNYWSHLFTVTTIVGIFSMIVLSGVQAQFTPDDDEKPADRLPMLPEEEPTPEPVDEAPEQPKGPYTPGNF